MNIEKLLDSHLAEEQAKPRERSGKFSPSSFGQCYRRQVYNRKNVPVTNPPDARALRIFKIGKLTHEYIQSLIPNEKEVCEKHYDGEDFHGYADHVGDNYIEDFKTVNGFKFKKISRKDMTSKKVAEECPDYVMQIMAYCLWFDKPIGRLTFINKDDWQIRQYDFKLEDYKDLVEDEIQMLRAFWNRDRLPPPLPRLYGGNECRYCSWEKHCKYS